MAYKKNIIIALLFLPTSLLLWYSAQAESKRVEVYSLSQNYWDIEYGETLGEIASQLIPHNTRLQLQLMRDIVANNPDVFPDENADNMLTNKRLWLPNSGLKKTKEKPKGNYTVQSFRWGNVTKVRRSN